MELVVYIKGGIERRFRLDEVEIEICDNIFVVKNINKVSDLKVIFGVPVDNLQFYEVVYGG